MSSATSANRSSSARGPFRTVVVGDDGREGGRAAVALARALAPAADLVLAAAYPYDDGSSRTPLGVYGEALREEAEDRLARTRDAAGLRVAEVRLVAVPDTSPARGLHGLAERERADLVVVGSSHRGAVGRILLGDVDRALLHGASCPVAIAPRERPPSAIRAIGVAYDASPEAHAALQLAAAIARERGARLLVRYVVESSLLPSVVGMGRPSLHELLAELRHDAQQSLDRAVAMLGVRAEATAVVGLLPDALDHLAADVDLLVCGSRRWGAVRRVVLGSTADRLIHRATCPVLVVPRPTGAGDEAAGEQPVAERSGAAA